MLQEQSTLVRYDAACQALAAAHAVDEVKEIHDKAVAISSYARQARNRDLEILASEIRFRAERRIGELMEIDRQMGALSVGARGAGRPKIGGSKSDPRKCDDRSTLADYGIDKHLADRARKYAAVPTPKFEAMMAERRERINHSGARITVDLFDSMQQKAERRAKREAELGSKIVALPKKRFGVIYADPPWRFEPWSRETGMDRSAENHYTCSAVEEIIASCAVPSIAADDAVLALWATVPMMPQALEVMAAWDFRYRTNFCWAKDRIGPGYWNRNKHEILLLGSRGDVPCPAPGQQWDSLIEAPRRGHSEKPEIFLEMFESYFPTLPRIELYRRGPPRPGWTAWGNEVEPARVDQRYERQGISAVS